MWLEAKRWWGLLWRQHDWAVTSEFLKETPTKEKVQAVSHLQNLALGEPPLRFSHLPIGPTKYQTCDTDFQALVIPGTVALDL